MSRRPAVLLLSALLMLCYAPALSLADEAKAEPENMAKQRLAAIQAEAKESGDFRQAYKDTDELFEQVIGYVSRRELDLYTEVAAMRRLFALLSSTNFTGDHFEFMLENPKLASTLAFNMVPGKDRVDDVLALLDRLREAHGDDKVAKYHQLTAALMLVHDRHESQPFKRRVNENYATSVSAVELFDYYTKHEKYMMFGIKNVPTELLIYVVDTTASIEDMKWAIKNFRGNRTIGKVFHKVPYDYDALKGKTKDVTVKGLTLPNILKYGGVCADQAYFAASCGKALGIPTVICSAASATSSHAWVGYLQARGRKAWWNFDEGRYQEYQGIRGNIRHPQSDDSISDSRVGLLAEMIGSSMKDRQRAAALTDAARVIDQYVTAGEPFEPMPLVEADTSKPEPAALETTLRLLKLSNREFEGYAPAWLMFSELGSRGDLSMAQKGQIADVVIKHFGRKYPDFMMLVVSGLIEGIESPEQRDDLWDKLFKIVQRSRKDIAADIRMRQGDMWAEAGDLRRAGKAYYDIIEKYPNDGPFVVRAVQRVEEMLYELNNQQNIETMYEMVWPKLEEPKGASDMVTHSNWFRVGSMYVAYLRNLDKTRKADKIEEELKHRAKTSGVQW